MVNMSVIESCKFCTSNEFTLHDTLKVYNPDTDEENDINNVSVCNECGSYNFETEDFIIVQKEINTNKKLKTANLANYMNS